MYGHDCHFKMVLPSPIMSPSKIRALSPINLSDLSYNVNKPVNFLIICKRDDVVIEKTFELLEMLMSHAFSFRSTRELHFFAEKWVVARAEQDEQRKIPLVEFSGPTADIIDLIISLGGDGTVLYSAWLFQGVHVPLIIPIYLHGTLGFLTLFTDDKLVDCIEQSINLLTDLPSHLATHLRMRLRCCIHRQSCSGSIETYHVLNELVIDRGPNPFMVNLDIFGNEAFMTNVMADGIVVATPTGSTAYSVRYLQP